MACLFQPPANHILSLSLLVISLFCLGNTLRNWIGAYRDKDETKTALSIVRGLRNLVIGLTAGAWAAGIHWSQKWLIIIGFVILVQEIYEMGFLSLTLKAGDKINN